MSEMSRDDLPEVSQLHLRDRLLATLVEFQVKEPYMAVEAVCDQMSGWLRAQADEWHEMASRSGDIVYGRAAALMCQGLADGIEAGRPPKVADKDPGVQ